MDCTSCGPIAGNRAMGKGTKLFCKRFSSVRIHHHFGFLMGRGWAGIFRWAVWCSHLEKNILKLPIHAETCMK